MKAGLRVYVESLAPGSQVMVPRESLLELLLPFTNEQPSTSPDLTVAEVAAKYGRSTSTVRGWIIRGLIAGTYKFQNRELRIPPASLLDFERNQRPSDNLRIVSPSRKGAVDMAEYKHAS